MSLQDGLNALQKQRYSEAIQLLETFFNNETADRTSSLYIQGQMALVRAYRGNGESKKAITLCEELENHDNKEIKHWAKSLLSLLNNEENKITSPADTPKVTSKAGRITQTDIKLLMPKVADSLSFASAVTILLLLAMVLVFSLGIFLIFNQKNPGLGLVISIIITLIFNGAAFFLSPWIMDLIQNSFYKTRWVSFAEINRHSPESAELILRVCREKKITVPRLGIIDDQNPTAFTYGSLPNRARLVVSQGLFTYLDAEEIVTVYAHELGHIIHWDFAIMTLASTLVQITYLIYIFFRQIGKKGGQDNKLKDGLEIAAIAAYLFYIIGNYILLYLSRTREYYADHFAAETTGNPNGLARALVKIAYGIVEEAQKTEEPSNLIEGTRALGIYDPKTATTAGTAYRITGDIPRVGRVFLWDMFNPWAFWMELNSTHPLTGKRIRALTTYAEQMGLETEFNMAAIIKEGNKLNNNKLYSNFSLDIFLFSLPFIGVIIGALVSITSKNHSFWLSSMLYGLGIGILSQTLVIYPSYQQASDSDIFTLMSDPYASPLRAISVRLKGGLIGRGEAGYKFGSDLQLQDRTGMIFLRYSSFFGPLGNFFFGWNKVKRLIGSSVNLTGWFRRGMSPWVDLIHLKNEDKTISSYPRFVALLLGFSAIILGFVISRFMTHAF